MINVPLMQGMLPFFKYKKSYFSVSYPHRKSKQIFENNAEGSSLALYRHGLDFAAGINGC